MTNWTLETLEDFEGVFFDAGMGWKALFEIHLAISLRHRYVAVSSHFNTQISGIVWTDDDKSDVVGDLRTELKACYSAIVGLVNGGSNFKWTQESGRSPEWTIESMVADIGMGEFEDLLIRTQSPEPFVWLIAAINRLNHPKILRPLQTQEVILVGPGFNGDYRENISGEYANSNDNDSQEEAWDSVAYDADFRLYTRPFPSGTISYTVFWSSGWGGFGGRHIAATRQNFKLIALAGKDVDGGYYPSINSVWTRPLKINCIDYPYSLVPIGYTGGDWTVQIGSTPETNVGRIHASGILEGTDPDMDFAGDTTVELRLLTPKPASSPFLTVTPFSGGGNISFRLGSVWVYCDLPEIMGAGELTAATPTVSAAAEQEE